MKKVSVALLTIGLLSAFSVGVDAKPGKAKKHDKQTQQNVEEISVRHHQTAGHEDKEPWLKVKLSIPEKGTLMRLGDQIIKLPREPQPQHTNLPPGLAKKVARGKRLPPGWQRKMAIGKRFPDSFYDQAIPLPPYIIQQLPVQPEGTILVTVGGKVVRLLEATKTIADVFDLKW